MAESELGVLSTQCLDRRIPDKQTLTNEVAAWEQNRKTHHTKADWQFTTADARIGGFRGGGGREGGGADRRDAVHVSPVHASNSHFGWEHGVDGGATD
jgi:hypothetical protein